MKQTMKTIALAIVAIVTAWGGHIYAQPPTTIPDRGGSYPNDRGDNTQSVSVSRVSGWLICDSNRHVRQYKTCQQNMFCPVSGYLLAGCGSSSPCSRGDVLQDKRHDPEPALGFTYKMGNRDDSSHRCGSADTEIYGIRFTLSGICKETRQRRKLVRVGAYHLTSRKGGDPWMTL